MTNNSDLIELTGEIVAAHVSNNNVAVSDLPDLIQKVHEALKAVTDKQSRPEVRQPKTPAVSIKSSVKPDYVVCLVCGSKQAMLKRHLLAAHRLTAAEYRADYGLSESYPLVSPNYREKRSVLAKSFGLGEKGRTAKRRPKGR